MVRKNKNVFTIVTKAEFQSNNFKCKKKKSSRRENGSFFSNIRKMFIGVSRVSIFNSV